MTLKEWREKRGLKQSELAAELGWSQSNLSRIELGTQEMTHEQMRQVHKASAGLLNPNSVVLGE